MPKISVGESFIVAKISGIEKVWIRGAGGGPSRLSVENFLSHSAENFRKVILYCCNNFGYRKSLDKRGEEYQDFPSKVFCLTVPKISVGESFIVAKISGIEKVWIRGAGGGPSRLSVENFLSHSAENFRKVILYCCNNFGYRKSLDKRGGSTKIFQGIFFVSQYRKILLGNTSVYQKISGSEKFYASERGRGEGVSRFSVENFLSHSAENFRRGILYCCNNFGYRKSLDKRGGGGVARFPSKIFYLTVPKISVG